MLRRVINAYVIVSIAFLLCSCVLSPNAEQSIIVPTIPANYHPPQETDEYEIWTVLAKLEARVSRSPLLVRDAALHASVKQIVCRLAHEYCEDIRVFIMRNPGFNALMYPNGMMVIWTGLLLRMESESHLASVIGHEMGHFLRQHGLESWRRKKRMSTATTLLGVGFGLEVGEAEKGDLTDLNILDALFKYSKQHELEADQLGIQSLAAAGYAPMSAWNVWSNMVKEEQHAIYKRKRLFFFRSHPISAARLEHLKALASGYPTGDSFSARYWQTLSPHYVDLILDQVNTNKPGRTSFLLNEHENYPISKGLVHFGWGAAAEKGTKLQGSSSSDGKFRESPHVQRCPGYNMARIRIAGPKGRKICAGL